MGLADILPPDRWVGNAPNSYSIGVPSNGESCMLAGKRHDFEIEWSNKFTKTKSNGIGEVFGCGILMNSNNKLAIFFTSNGKPIGQF
jgi:hypothetical protein